MPPLDLYQEDWPIRSYQAQTPPARTVPGVSGTEGIFINSIVAGGTVIAGGSVQHSILFPQVFVDDGAFVEDAILFQGVRIGAGARLRRCIVDKDVAVPPREQIGYDLKRDSERFTVSEQGIVVVPKGYRFA
jgi:glucose-1-phosphate adenylyltransferase